MLTARSIKRFPSLAGPMCPWHDDCTPMDCENFRTVPPLPGAGKRQKFAADAPVSSGNRAAVPVKKAKRRNQ